MWLNGLLSPDRNPLLKHAPRYVGESLRQNSEVKPRILVPQIL